MSQEKKHTDGDLARAQQQAFVHGVSYHALYPFEYDSRYVAAKQRYPVPKVTRPREVSTGRGIYRVIDGVPHEATVPGWRRSAFSAKDIQALADLLANPTEEVEADD